MPHRRGQRPPATARPPPKSPCPGRSGFAASATVARPFHASGQGTRGGARLTIGRGPLRSRSASARRRGTMGTLATRERPTSPPLGRQEPDGFPVSADHVASPLATRHDHIPWAERWQPRRSMTRKWITGPRSHPPRAAGPRPKAAPSRHPEGPNRHHHPAGGQGRSGNHHHPTDVDIGDSGTSPR